MTARIDAAKLGSPDPCDDDVATLGFRAFRPKRAPFVPDAEDWQRASQDVVPNWGHQDMVPYFTADGRVRGWASRESAGAHGVAEAKRRGAEALAAAEQRDASP